MKDSEKLILEKYNGIHPICGCGCGEKTIYDYSSKDFGKFKRGHQTRVNKNYFGDPKNPKRVEKIIATRKFKFASGEYDHVLNSIKENRKNPELGRKISKGSKGKPKPKPKGFGIGRKQSKITKNKMSKSHKLNWENGNIGRKHYTSKLENKFEEIILKFLNLEYKKFFKIKGHKYFYDFYLTKYNLIIEVDGDFFHSNPKFYPNGPIYKTQIQNNLKDQIKNNLSNQNGFKLLRFWEYDINNNSQQIIEQLKKELNIT